MLLFVNTALFNDLLQPVQESKYAERTKGAVGASS